MAFDARVRRMGVVAVSAAGLSLALGCEPEAPTWSPAPVFVERSLSTVDEELFGDVFENGLRTTSSAYYAILTPSDPVTDARILSPRSFTIWANPSAIHMYGWWDPAGAGSCGDLAQYQAGQRGQESHWSGPGQPPTPGAVELHCIRPGIYNFSVEDKAFRVDYLQTAGNNFTVNNTTAGVLERLEAFSYSQQQAANWVDHVVHVDLTPSGSQETRVLDVQNAHADSLKTTFADTSNPSGNENDWFRFSVARSSTTWNRNSQGRMLAQLYWDYDRNKNIRTNYYDAHSTANVIRYHRFKDHVAESRNVVVALELMRPDEAPNDTVNVTTRIVQIARITPFACASTQTTTTWRTTDQYLSAGCSARGANIRYSWQFVSGGPWTPESADTLYDFVGHVTAGTPTVTLKVRDVSTNVSGTRALPVTVRDSQVTLTGRTFVTDKATNLYQSWLNGGSLALNGWWFERWNPDLYWWPATSEPRSDMTRIWYAGNYTVELRQQDSTAARVRRGRLSITVCNPCVDPVRFASAPALTPGEPWGLFGGGPWISWGSASTANALRFYDLLGMHDVANRFTDATWLDDAGGVAATTGTGRYLSWAPRALGLEDVKAFEFTLALPAGTPLGFGFALDPDLGPNAADDVAGYDGRRGMAYVHDGARAVGFLLREATGGNALQGVVQYGLRRHPPVSSTETWTALRSTGVQLLAGASDVQLLLTSAARTGTVTRTFVIVRGANLAELQSRADLALAELSR